MPNHTDHHDDTRPVAPRLTTLLPSPTKVVELGEAVSTAVCGQYLERLGADVIRVVPVGVPSPLDSLHPMIGDGDAVGSAVAERLRHGKELVAPDIGTDEGRSRLEQLLSEADVVLIAGTTASWESHGLSLELVRTLARSAVVGHVTPWGDAGPRSELPGGELLAQAAGGLMNLVGRADREPVRLGGYPMQSATGLAVLDGVMVGLFHRRNTGDGSWFSTSEFESTAYLEWKIASSVQAGRVKERRGDEGGGPTVTRTVDGHFGFFFTPRHWADVKMILDDPRLEDDRFATPKDRAANETEFRAILEQNTRSYSKKDLYERAQARGIPAGHVATMTDLLHSSQYRARSFFREIEIEGIGPGEIPDAPWQVLTLNDIEAGGGSR